MTTLEIKDLHVSVVSKEDGTDIPILKGVDLTVKSGETHALMGPERVRKVDACRMRLRAIRSTR